VNCTRLPVRGSPTRLSTLGQQSYKGWSRRRYYDPLSSWGPSQRHTITSQKT